MRPTPRLRIAAIFVPILFFTCFSFLTGCASYVVTLPPPSLSKTELIAHGPSVLSAGLAIDEELRKYVVSKKAWNTVSYTFHLGDPLAKVIEEAAQLSFPRVVPVATDNPWEAIRQEKLDRLVVVSLENAVLDLQSIGALGVQGVANVRITLRVQVYDQSKHLLDEKVLMGEGTSSEPADMWGSPRKDTFTPGIEAALQDTGRKLLRYFSQVKS